MNTHNTLLPFVLISLLSATSAFSQEFNPGIETLVQLLENMKRYHDDGRIERREPEARPLVNQGEDGRVRHLAAAPGHAFQPGRITPERPEETARMFLEDTSAMYGIDTPNADFIPFRTVEAKSRTSVRLQQRYRGVPVVDGQIVVQMNPSLGVVYLVSDVAVEINALDGDPAWMVPVVTPKDIGAIIAGQLKEKLAKADPTNTPPQLAIFVPSVLDETGDMRLVWQTEVSSETAAEINARWLIDAKTGDIVRRYPLAHSALNRRVLDRENSVGQVHTLRTEGEGPTNVGQVDDCYDFLGDTYEFYWDWFDRDSYDHDGAQLKARVRKCITDPDATCPWPNAQWIKALGVLRFGDGYAVDDVVAHEFTHAVIDNTSDLTYANTSGAINESLADIFGEFVDWSNSAGNDSAGVRWRIGEDIPTNLLPDSNLSLGALRSMSFPALGGGRSTVGNQIQPVEDPDKDNDFGGVHSNSGINNKLCYLLTDGDDFNGWTVDGMGMGPVVRLYYHANAQLLPKAANWDDLFYALRQSAVYWEWTEDEQLNLLAACRAVEIGSPEDVYISNSASCIWPNGAPACGGFFGGPYPTVTEGVDGAFPGDRLFIYDGSYDVSFTFNKPTVIRAVDGTAVIGE